MDEVRWDYYREIGYEKAREDELAQAGGFEAVYRYWKPFEIHAVERLLAESRDCVIDFGAGHSVFEDDETFARAQLALAPYKNVVLLLPSPDLDASVRILRERTKLDAGPNIDFCEHFVRHRSNHALAKITVYTEGLTPEETCAEILTRIGAAPPDGRYTP